MRGGPTRALAPANPQAGQLELEDSCRRDLACLLERRVYVRGDCVIRAGAVSENMFFIAAGTVEVIIQSGCKCASLPPPFGLLR